MSIIVLCLKLEEKQLCDDWHKKDVNCLILFKIKTCVYSCINAYALILHLAGNPA